MLVRGILVVLRVEHSLTHRFDDISRRGLHRVAYGKGDEVHAICLCLPDPVPELHEEIGRNIFEPVCKDVHTNVLILSLELKPFLAFLFGPSRALRETLLLSNYRFPRYAFAQSLIARPSRLMLCSETTG